MGKLKKVSLDKKSKKSVKSFKEIVATKPGVIKNKMAKLRESNRSKLNSNIKKTTSLKNKSGKLKVETALKLAQKPEEKDTDSIENNIDQDSVRSGIKALFKILEESKNDKSLFEDEVPIFLQFSAVKIGRTPSRTLRIPLKHSLLKENSEVCLITDDVRGHSRKEFEKTTEHYEKLLLRKGVTNIKTIMPFYQFKTEYTEFELKRKLVGLYDMFLVDSKITSYTFKKLGKIFMNKRKLPIPVRLDANNLKDTIDFALRKTSTNLHPYGDNFIIQIAHSEMSEDQIHENFNETCANLSKQFPGGWDNIRGINLKIPTSLAVPIYCTIKNPIQLPRPVARAKRPKTCKAVTGELSTVYDREVKVLPSGEVTLQKPQLKRVSNRDDDSDESDGEFRRMYKRVEKENKAKCPNVPIRNKIAKKQGVKKMAKQVKLKSKVLTKAKMSVKSKNGKTKLQIPNKKKTGAGMMKKLRTRKRNTK